MKKERRYRLFVGWREPQIESPGLQIARSGDLKKRLSRFPDEPQIAWSSPPRDFRRALSFEIHILKRARTPTRHAGATFPRVRIAQETKLTKNRQERPSLQHKLLAFSGFAGLRLFAAFVKLDQAYPPLKSRALRTQNSLRTIGWSEVSSFKVMNASSLS